MPPHTTARCSWSSSQRSFIPIDLDYPGLRILNFDPAVFTVAGSPPQEDCNSWQQRAEESGAL